MFDYQFESLTHLYLANASSETISQVSKVKHLKSVKLQKLGDEWSSVDVQELSKLNELEEIGFFGSELSDGAAEALFLLSDRNLKLDVKLDSNKAEYVIGKIGAMIANLTVNLESPLPVLPLIIQECPNLRSFKVNGSEEV